MMKLFRNRQDAGRELAREVEKRVEGRILVLGLPRGGVPVAYEVAKAVNGQLDTLVVRKLGVPTNPEYGFGAVAPGDVIVIDERVRDLANMSERQVREVEAMEMREMERRMNVYQSGSYAYSRRFDTAVIVDDGIATGATMKAAIRSAKMLYNPDRLVLAVPVAPRDLIEAFRMEADEVICLFAPASFGAVGEFYESFAQVTDKEVNEILEQRRLEWMEP